MKKVFAFIFMLFIMFVPLAVADGLGGNTAGFGSNSGGGTPGGSSGEVQYNDSDALGGASNLTVSSNGVVSYIGTALSASGSGTVTSSTSGEVAWFSATGTTVVGNPALVTTAAGDLSANGDVTVQGVIFSTDSTLYALLTMSTNQTSGLTAGEELAFTKASGNLVVNNTTHVVTLPAGGTYILQAAVKSYNASGTLNYGWYDRTNSAYLLGGGAQIISVDLATDHTPQPVTTSLVKTTTDIDVEVRVSANTAIDALESAVCWAVIYSIERNGV